MSKNAINDLGNKITGAVKDALSTGDLNRLKDIGPAVQDAVSEVVPQNTLKPPPPPPGMDSQSYNQTYGRPAPSRPAWTGKAPEYHPPEGTYSSPPQRSVPPRNQPQQGYSQTPQNKNLPAVYQRGSLSNAGVGSMIGGAMGLVATGISTLLFGLIALTTSSVFAIPAIGTLFGMVQCVLLIGRGNGKNKMARRIRQYYAELDKNPVQTFEALALRTGIPEETIRKDIKKSAGSKLMPDVRMDQNQTCLMQGDEAYRLYIETEENRVRREQEELERAKRMADPATAGIETFKEEGRNALKKIREANDALDGVEISEKLDKLEATTSKIFEYVKQHPGKLPDTRRFMSYYLPTTMKIVEKYRQYESMEVKVASVQKAMEEIESTLDTINEAFLNLLDSMYHDDTLDVSTDIEVLQAVLEQEGLTGKSFEVDAPAGGDSPFNIET